MASIRMSFSSLHEEEEDDFFDSHDHICTPDSSVSSDDTMVNPLSSDLRALESALWTRELMSIQERRQRFLHRMGFHELVSSQLDSSAASQEIVDDRDNSVLDTLPCSSDEGREGLSWQSDSFSASRQSSSPSPTSDSSHESFSAQQFMEKVAEEKQNHSVDSRNDKCRRWWRSLSMCKQDVSVKDCKVPSKITRARIQNRRKRCKGLGALHVGQEIQAHKGLIRTMKFNQSGSYLASGGQDCILRIWQVREGNISRKCPDVDGYFAFIDNVVLGKLQLSVVIRKKDFKIEEIAVQEFHGHTSDILDISWSKSDYVLSSSKDKTVRLWRVSQSGCLGVFRHNDYVTCIQFNPLDERLFISGSIDGKVRIWGLAENRVMDWVDAKDIVTAICYRPDGKGFLVGSIKGSCRMYNYGGDELQLDGNLCMQKKKSAGKPITGLQFSPYDSEIIMITSADSSVQIVDGIEVINKFKGPWWSRGQSYSSFTAHGRCIISVSEDSSAYMWNYGRSVAPSSKGDKLTCPCEPSFSEGVSAAVQWPGLEKKSTSLIKNMLRSLSQPIHNNFSPISPQDKQEGHHHHQYKYFTLPLALVVATASYDGVIRSFLKYGLPIIT